MLDDDVELELKLAFSSSADVDEDAEESGPVLEPCSSALLCVGVTG